MSKDLKKVLMKNPPKNTLSKKKMEIVEQHKEESQIKSSEKAMAENHKMKGAFPHANSNRGK